MNSPTHSAASTTESNPKVDEQKLQLDTIPNPTEPVKKVDRSRSLIERYRQLVIKIKTLYAKLDPDVKKTLLTVLRVGGMGLLTYFSIDGIINITEQRYKSLSVVLLGLEALYIAFKSVRSSNQSYKLALLAIIVLAYCQFLKTNMYDKNIVEMVASKKVNVKVKVK